MVVHCLFEQSGTFKNAFKKLGLNAFDYDIEGKETNVICDIFAEIKDFFNGEFSIFDRMQKNDIIIAFFPCTYFSNMSKLNSRGENKNVKLSNNDKLKNAANLAAKRYEYFIFLLALIKICYEKKLRLIVENPYLDNYLLDYLPKCYEMVKFWNRQKYGDNYKKPTMFLFFNCTPKFSMLNENIQFKNNNRIDNNKGFQRSLITSEFADFFIKNFIEL